MSTSTWDLAVSHRAQTLQAIKSLQVQLPSNPVGEKNIGGLNEKLAQVRSYLNTVRDHIFDSQALMIGLRNEAHGMDDLYEDKLAAELERMTTLSEEDKKKLPKTAEEREILFRRSCPIEYHQKKTAARQVEEWELYQKMLYTIYYSLRDTNNDISAQVAIIKQQYFSGEVEVSKAAKGLFDFLSEETKQLFNSQEQQRSDFVPTEDGMEVIL